MTRNLIFIIGMIILSFFACSKSEKKAETQKFGADLTIDEPTALASVYAEPVKYDGKELRIDGTITEVCQRRGCWLKLTDGNYILTVRFRDYGFFVPKDAANARVSVQGIFQAETDAHIEQEAQEQNPGLMNREKSFTLTASAVVIEASGRKSDT